MTRPLTRGFAAVVAALLVAGACATASAQPGVAPVPSVAAPASSCDPIGGPRCLLPFPNDYYTVPDPSTDTGRRVALQRDSLPANSAGVHIDPTEQNRNDGFSPGSALLALLPGVDLARSGAAPRTDIGASLARSAPIVLFDADTGRRVPYWVEMDSNATTDADRLLMVRPAVSLAEGHRFVVGFRRLMSSTGAAIEPTAAFRAYRDSGGKNRGDARGASMEKIFKDLRRAKVDRRDLILAWDFTVASERSLSERLLHMRDDAFASLGRSAPAFRVDSVTEAASGPSLRTVKGTFDVPRYLTGSGEPGSVLNNGSAGSDPLPRRNGTQTANFTCVLPRSAVGADGAARPSDMALYGHGLLGSADEVEGAGPRFQAVSNTTFCATDWIGMSQSDVANAVQILGDLSRFRSMADRLQQGILDFLFLGRLMKHPDGLSSSPAFRDAAGRPLVDRSALTFVGLSQGGILGGATSAVAQDWQRVLLGVPGLNYSLLLNRSIDFDAYGAILDPAYPSAVDRQLGLQLIQMLWDRGENDGYVQHLTRDPYRGTKRKQVLLFEAFGDHQVANISTEVLARTIGARVRVPALAPGRTPDVEPFWGIRPVRRLPDKGDSYLVMWDFGTPPPPVGNVAPREGEDPHGKGSREPRVQQMTGAFLRSGTLIDVCGGAPCQTPAG